jgi:hypothetical protein
MKMRVKAQTRCCDQLIEIAGNRFLGVPTQRCLISAGQVVEIVDGPVEIAAGGQNAIVVKTRHLNDRGETHEGWSLRSDLEDV